MKKTTIIIVFLLILIAAGATYYFFFWSNDQVINESNLNQNISTANNSNVTTNTNQSADYSEFTQVIDQYIETGQEGDLEKQSALIYYGTELFNLISPPGSRSNEDYQTLINYVKTDFTRTYNNVSYTVKEAEINDDEATLVLSAVKNGRQKNEKRSYFIKNNGQWQINTFGWYHPADSQTESLELCNQYCQDNGYGGSGNLHASATQECFCYHYAPAREISDQYKVESCEKIAINFQDACYISEAVNQQEENICKNIRTPNIDSCYEKVAKAKQDISVCDYLWDDEKCLNSIITSPTNTNQTTANQNNNQNNNTTSNTNQILDQDGDGLSDSEEAEYGTDPIKSDTDGDGYDDKTEIDNGFNPNGEGKL